MIREYKTIEEVAGPLMLVKQVEGQKKMMKQQQGKTLEKDW